MAFNDLAERAEIAENLGSRLVADPYRWLEDANDPRTVRWLIAQQAIFARARAQWQYQNRFRRRLAELTEFEHCSVPVWRGQRAFYTRRMPDDEHPCLRTQLYADTGEPAGPDRVLADPAAMDQTGQTTLEAWVPSQDGSLIACQFSAGGTEQSVLRVLDVSSGAFAGSSIGDCRSSAIAWLPGRPAFYYVLHPPGAPPQVRLHQADRQPDEDLLVFEADQASDLDIALDRTGRQLTVTVITGLSSATDLWLVQGTTAAELDCFRIAACQGGWSVAWPGRDGLLYLLTDDHAPRGRIVAVTTARARRDRGRTLVAEDGDTVLDAFAVLDGPRLARPAIVVLRNHAGHSVLTCHDLQTGERFGDVPLPGAGVVKDLSFKEEGGHEIWFEYTDALTPPTVYRHDLTTGRTTPWRHIPSRGPRGIQALEMRYPSTDGTRVRLLLTRPAGRNGPLPTIVHGYGAFGEPQFADYYELALAWAEAGGAFAIPCVRGGGDEGESWHRAGMLAGKQRSIDDLLAAAEYLIASGIAAPGQ